MLANIFLGNLWRKFVLKKALVTRYHNNNGTVGIPFNGTVTRQNNGDVHSRCSEDLRMRKTSNGDVHSKMIDVDQIGIPCYRCGKSLDIGTEVWSHPNGCKTKYYCPGCYDKLWL